MFLKRLLTVPTSTSTTMCHSELGMIPLSFHTQLAPLLLWYNIWAKEEPVLNRAVITDCLKLEWVNKIPWIPYIRAQLRNLGLSDCFDNPGNIVKMSRAKLKKEFLAYSYLKRDTLDMGKKWVTEHSLLVCPLGTEFNLFILAILNYSIL